MTTQADHIPEGDFQLIITFLPSDEKAIEKAMVWVWHEI